MEDDLFGWQSEAACKGLPISYFFKEEHKKKYRSDFKQFCDRCTVKETCLEIAIIYNFDGVWGGLTDAERRVKYGPRYRKYLIEELKELGLYKPLYCTV